MLKFAFCGVSWQAAWPLWDSDEYAEGVSYNIEHAAQGTYTLTISSPIALPTLPHAAGRAAGKHGMVILSNVGADRSFSHLVSYNLLQGDQVRGPPVCSSFVSL